MTIRAIYEGGVFKPMKPVDLPDKAEVEFEYKLLPAAQDDERIQEMIYEVLGRSVASGESNVAERHNEHQP